MRRNDDLNAARGIINGIAIGLAIWLIILAIFAIAARADMAQPVTLPPIEIVPSAERAGGGYTAPDWPIYLREGYDRQQLLHEIGHHVDYMIPGHPTSLGEPNGGDPFRYRFRQLIGDERPWRTTGGNSPHEKFAEAYALCSLKDPAKATLRWLRWDYAYSYAPSVRTHRKVCRTIENAMARYPEMFS
jgi:hypothetical protein